MASCFSSVPRSMSGAALVMTLAGCSGAVEPFPFDAVHLERPAAYTLWWEMVEQCSGLTAELDRVTWFVLPGREQFQIGGQVVHGYWWSSGNRIVLAEGAVLSPRLVRHEMLHAILGRGGHSAEQFRTRCGGIVSCDGECAREAMPRQPPPGTAPELAAGDLGVTLRIDPHLPSKLEYGGWFAVDLNANAPSGTPLSAGEHAIRGFFNNDSTPALPLIIAP